MARTTPGAPKNLRNGLKWREGRPRWEPSPSNRKAGLKGLDLRDGAAWLQRGEAVTICDTRAHLADLIRPAVAGDLKARASLERVLAALGPPETPDEKMRRALVQDLLEAASQALQRDAPAAPVAPGQHTVREMVEGYFERPPLRPNPKGGPPLPPAAGTLKVYRSVSHKFLDEFGNRAASSIGKGELRTWYLKLCQGLSVATANVTMGAVGAFFAWASWQTPPWITSNPTHKLGLSSAVGRLVFWTLQEERAFTAWCDAHAYEDVADAVVFLAWTGASPVDACKPTLPELSGETWRYVRHKTRRKSQEALPGLLQPVKDRVALRAGRTVATLDQGFLIDPRGPRRHTPETLGARFREARKAAIDARDMPKGFADKRLQDLRDTCISRLAWAGVPLDRIPPWSGHTRADAQDVLRESYLCLREQETLDDLRRLEAWARKEGMAL